MKKSVVILTLIATTCLLMGSCSALFEENDNAKLYGTEWSTESEEEGLKFFKDDSVLYFSSYNRGSGTFEYNATTGEILFDGLYANFPSFTSEMPGAVMQANGTMYLYWHELGKSANYYMVLYRRR